MGRIVDAIKERLFREWLETGTVSREQLEAWDAGDDEVPAPIAIDARERFEIPLEWWPRIGPMLSLGDTKKQDKGKGIVHARDMEAALLDRGRGRPPTNPDHPIYAALARRGLTLRRWAEKSKPPRSLSTVAAWIKGRNKIPPAEAKAIAEEFEGEVPPLSWDVYRLRFLQDQRRPRRK